MQPGAAFTLVIQGYLTYLRVSCSLLEACSTFHNPAHDYNELTSSLRNHKPEVSSKGSLWVCRWLQRWLQASRTLQEAAAHHQVCGDVPGYLWNYNYCGVIGPHISAAAPSLQQFKTVSAPQRSLGIVDLSTLTLPDI